MNIISRINLVLFFVLLFLTDALIFSQENEITREVSLSMLIAPASPGFVLMGKEPASVEQPGSVSDFAVSVLNRTKDLTLLPLNYAVEVAPYWLIGAPQLTYEKFNAEGNPLENFLQTFSLSIASSAEEIIIPETPSLTVTSAAAGFRFSLLRGKIDTSFNKYYVRIDSIAERMKSINTVFHEETVRRKTKDIILDSLKKMLLDPDLTSEEINFIGEKLRIRNEQIENEIKKELTEPFKAESESIKNIISRLQLKRIGWKADLAAGILFDFLQQKFNKGELNRYGFWLNGGYEWTNFSGLGVFRFLNNPKNSGMNSFDIGGRFIYNLKKFGFSLEGILRKIAGSGAADQWRGAVIFDYYFAENKKISFTFGKNFEERFKFSHEGDIISAINLQFGFGTERPI